MNVAKLLRPAKERSISFRYDHGPVSTNGRCSFNGDKNAVFAGIVSIFLSARQPE